MCGDAQHTMSGSFKSNIVGHSHTQITDVLEINSHILALQVWRMPDLVLVTTLRGHKRGVWAVQFSPVDQAVATASGAHKQSTYMLLRLLAHHACLYPQICGNLTLVASCVCPDIIAGQASMLSCKQPGQTCACDHAVRTVIVHYICRLNFVKGFHAAPDVYSLSGHTCTASFVVVSHACVVHVFSSSHPMLLGTYDLCHPQGCRVKILVLILRITGSSTWEAGYHGSVTLVQMKQMRQRAMLVQLSLAVSIALLTIM